MDLTLMLRLGVLAPSFIIRSAAMSVVLTDPHDSLGGIGSDMIIVRSTHAGDGEGLCATAFSVKTNNTVTMPLRVERTGGEFGSCKVRPLLVEKCDDRVLKRNRCDKDFFRIHDIS